MSVKDRVRRVAAAFEWHEWLRRPLIWGTHLGLFLGWVARRSTARRIRSATSAAFRSESLSMCLRRATRCRIALRDHTTFIAALSSHPACPRTGATSRRARD